MQGQGAVVVTPTGEPRGPPNVGSCMCRLGVERRGPGKREKLGSPCTQAVSTFTCDFTWRENIGRGQDFEKGLNPGGFQLLEVVEVKMN